MAARDDIGSRGEYLFCARITDFCGRPLPFFRPRFLGEKARTLDYLVELVDAGGRAPFFFVQVKATRKGYTRRDRRLRVEMTGADVRRLGQVPAPTYLVGMDEPGEVGYILPILEGMKDDIFSVPTTYPLDPMNLLRLYEEVKEFWLSRDMSRRSSVFSF